MHLTVSPLWLALALAMSWAVTAFIAHHGGRLGLVSVPNARSSHEVPVPSGGGLSFVVVVSLLGVLSIFSGEGFLWVLSLAALVALVGLIDDRWGLSARVRLVVQFAVLSMAILTAAPPVLELPGGYVVQGGLLFTLGLLAGVWWVNLYNFMDGIDGLAATQGIFMLASAATLSGYAQPEVMSDPLWATQWLVVAAALGFLLLNWPPARIFMGDVGSTWLAFVIFAFGLLSIDRQWLNLSAWLILAALFITDATVTLIRRALGKQALTQAHRSHAYQRLSRRWAGENRRGHLLVTVAALGINLLYLAPLAALSTFAPSTAMHCVLAAYVPLILISVSLGAGKADQR